MFLTAMSFFTAHAGSGAVTLTSVFNNVPCVSGLQTGWGYACLIEGLTERVLFDTGADGDILLSNLRRLGKDPADIDIIVLSHIHHDHIGGLDALLETNHHVVVYVPASFPPSMKESIRKRALDLVEITQPTQIAPFIFTTGELGHSIREQGLVLKTAKGLVVITGCAHPGIVNMVKRAKEFLKESIHLVMGGFHLSGAGDGAVLRIIDQMQSLGVETVAPAIAPATGHVPFFVRPGAKIFSKAALVRPSKLGYKISLPPFWKLLF